MIYFLKEPGTEGPIKIGFSQNPSERVWQVARKLGKTLELIGSADATIAVETKVQNCFAHLHRGGEWFEATDELMEFIGKVVVLGVEVGAAIDLDAPTGSIRSTYRTPGRKNNLCRPSEQQKRDAFIRGLGWACAGYERDARTCEDLGHDKIASLFRELAAEISAAVPEHDMSGMECAA